MSRKTTRRQVIGLLESADRRSSSSLTQRHDIDILQLIDHFLDEETLWMGSPENQYALQHHGVKLGLEAPYLLHAILAFSSSHMYYQNWESRFKTAATYHYDRLLALYVSQLTKIDAVNIDHLLGTCNLHVMLSFFNVSVDHPEPFEDPEDHECDWNGFRALQGGSVLQSVPTLRDHLGKSVWLPALQASGQWDDGYKPIDEPIDIPADQTAYFVRCIEAVMDICDIPTSVHYSESPYFEPLRYLCDIVRGKLDNTAIGRLFAWVSKLSPTFVDMLEHMDPKCMVTMSYWFALLIRFGQWWTFATARHACRRIVVFIYKSAGHSLRALLQFPAETCGVDLDKVDLTKKAHARRIQSSNIDYRELHPEVVEWQTNGSTSEYSAESSSGSPSSFGAYT
ncbi:hypothetical protein BDV96DRAFT_644246 [Lophiotrema nucula]|uniref:Uncharacterized protein n=1 Tax=Lophiotrema nucula TaxID=690887 RepID=A0A6A5ZEH7_9PLEO|nr:hypothetical protein BDV96DRAFT_644246 [Lophiotrema nucula]